MTYRSLCELGFAQRTLGSITLTATRSLTARVSGSGTILYGGNPAHVTPTVTGTGTISPG